MNKLFVATVQLLISAESHNKACDAVSNTLYGFEDWQYVPPLFAGPQPITEQRAARHFVDYGKTAAIEQQVQTAPEGEEIAPDALDHLIFTVLCDGLYYFGGYGFRLTYSGKQYNEAADALKAEGKIAPCLEDVQLRMLHMGYGLTFQDIEGAGENTKVLTMKLVRDNLDRIPLETLKKIRDEDYDAGDADEALQYILFGELIFG